LDTSDNTLDEEPCTFTYSFSCCPRSLSE